MAALCCVAYASGVAFAQGEIDVQPKVFFRNEWSVAIMLNSNGLGGNFRYGKRIDAFNKRLFEVDFAYIKHPKENKTYSIVSSGGRFVYGKTNLAFDFRFAYGRQHEMYRKQDVGSIAIRYFYNYGPSLAILKPIYYNVGDIDRQQNLAYERDKPERFDPQWWLNNEVVIFGQASFFKGFDGLSVVPGAFGKFGFNFEFSKKDRVIHAIECGLIAEGFIKRLPIMDFRYAPTDKTSKNQQFILTLYVSYRIGRIVDPYEVKKKKKRRSQTNDISY